MTSGVFPLADVIAVRAASGRVLVPANQFARLEHISGMPAAGQEGGGYSITKLRILDAFLDRLAILKGERPEVETKGLSDGGLDSVLDEMQSYLRDSLQKAAATPFGAALGAGASADVLIINFWA
jgi:hypothetical protein